MDPGTYKMLKVSRVDLNFVWYQFSDKGYHNAPILRIISKEEVILFKLETPKEFITHQLNMMLVLETFLRVVFSNCLVCPLSRHMGIEKTFLWFSLRFYVQ